MGSYNHKNFSQVLLHTDTKELLKKAKIRPNEPMNNVIVRLLKRYNKPEDKPSIVTFKEEV